MRHNTGMITSLEIRRASPADADALVAGNLAMAAETEARGLDPAVLRAGVEAVLRDAERGTFWVATRGGRVVGQMLITLEWSDWRNGWFWWIQSVFVVKEERKAGVYRALHEHVERAARARGDVCGLRLYVERENTIAQRVYQRMGMTETHYHLYEIDWSSQPGPADDAAPGGAAGEPRR